MTDIPPMDSRELIRRIDDAKDSAGAITQTSLKDQLGSLTPADWRQAAAIFSRSATTADGFYIVDDAGGKVTIHNDLTRARELADNSVLTSTLDDGKTVGAAALAAEGFVALPWGATLAFDTWAGAGAGSGVGLLSSTVLGAGAAATGEAALVVGAAAGVVGGAVLAGDYVRNYFRKGTAQDDLKNAGELTLNGGQS